MGVEGVGDNKSNVSAQSQTRHRTTWEESFTLKSILLHQDSLMSVPLALGPSFWMTALVMWVQ